MLVFAVGTVLPPSILSEQQITWHFARRTF